MLKQLLALLAAVLAIDDVYIEGTGDVGLIFVQGAQVRPSAYVDLLERVVQETGAHVAIPHITLNMALPFNRVNEAIEKSRAELIKRGLSSDAKLVIVGHSLGGVAAQDYVKTADQGGDDGQLVFGSQVEFAGTVLLGSSLLRKYNASAYPHPIMSISGTLDGLHRPSRVAETYHHQILQKSRGHPEVNYVMLIEGMNHMQVGTQKPPFVPGNKDLKAEILGDDARNQVASLISEFIKVHIKNQVDDSKLLSQYQSLTGQFLKPILETLHQEAHVHIKTPCNSDNPAPHCPFYPIWPAQPKDREVSAPQDCWCETPWAAVAIAQMVDVPSNVKVVSRDSIHDVRDTKPFHHAHVWNNVTQLVKDGKQATLNVTTVSESVYDKYDHLDSGISSHHSAAEIRVKMKSRQLYRRYTTNPFADYDEDKNNVCAEVNEMAYKWALAKADNVTRMRFEKYGQKMVFAPDYHFPIAIGPLWINKRLVLKDAVVDGAKVLKVQAISMRTDLDSWINNLHPDSAGQHYCKLLSPARALEWIYTDGLLDKLKLKDHLYD